MFSTEIYSGQYINKNTVYTSTISAWNDMCNLVKSQNNDYIFSEANADDIQYDLLNGHIHITLSGFSVEKYVDLFDEIEQDLYYIRGISDFSLKFDENLNLTLNSEDSDSLYLDIVLGEIPQNTEIIVTSSYFNYNYSAYKDMYYALLKIKYWKEHIDEISSYKLINLISVDDYFIFAGNEYKRLNFLINDETSENDNSYKIYCKAKNNEEILDLKKIFENNNELLNKLIVNNHLRYEIPVTGNPTEYYVFEFKLFYSDIKADSLYKSNFTRFKNILNSVNRYENWLASIIGEKNNG